MSAPRSPASRVLGLSMLVAALASGCGGGGSSAEVVPPPTDGAPASVERDVSPKTIDPQVDDRENRDHVAINPNPAVAATGRLFVMLPGTGGSPSMYRYVLRSGATRGFHAIGLDYANPEAVGQICARSTDDNCFWDVRREIITGNDTSRDVAIAAPDAIITRLTKALNYLHSAHPGEGWGQYLVSGTVNWSKVVIAGHSQGGGHAGVIAKLFVVNRAVYFSSPADWNLRTDAPAGWTAAAGATSTDRQFGFAHLDDHLVPWNQLERIWRATGLVQIAGIASVDSTTPPYDDSHALTTAATPRAGGQAADPEHGAPVLDSVTPIKGDGTPLFDEVWAYLAFR